MPFVPRFRPKPRAKTPAAPRLDAPASETERLQRENARLRAIADNLPAVIACIDREHRITFANRGFQQWHGTTGEIVGRHLADVIGDRDYVRRREPLSRALAGEPVTFESDIEWDGGMRTFQTVLLPEVSRFGRVEGLYTLATDVTALRAAERHMAALALSDTLTGLPNRRRLEERLPEALARAKRNGTGLAVVLLDVDHFKRINDTHSHAAGDAVLTAFAECLRTSVRATDFVARLAGDEFVLVLEGLHRAEESDEVTEKVVDAVRRLHVDVAGASIGCATSAGVAFLPPERSCAPQRLVTHADEALYVTKARGRDGFTRHVVEGDRPASRLTAAR